MENMDHKCNTCILLKTKNESNCFHIFFPQLSARVSFTSPWSLTLTKTVTYKNLPKCLWVSLIFQGPLVTFDTPIILFYSTHHVIAPFLTQRSGSSRVICL